GKGVDSWIINITRILVNYLFLNNFLRSDVGRRSLLPCKRKNHLAGWFFEGSVNRQVSEPW
ncbi:hypothetical protein, partial [Klebsiella pneumoniae]|uniref:hypothetical protein n=1 Tax=Klebsiella pneumoniae TaxID=573 RepID=UPI001CC206D5